MLRHVIERHSFGRLLGMAASYAIGATACALLIADGVVRKSMLWPRLISTVMVVLN
jgi:hypothetical protein